jgi:hypothetical protein
MSGSATWVKEDDGWILKVAGAPGQPSVVLLAYLDPSDPVEPWTWEAVEAVETGRLGDQVLEFGGARDLKSAKLSAERWAAVYRYVRNASVNI